MKNEQENEYISDFWPCLSIIRDVKDALGFIPGILAFVDGQFYNYRWIQAIIHLEVKRSL